MNASIEILLRPFHYQDQLIDTSIRLDRIELPDVFLRSLVDRSFQFPVNPDDKAIDGSLYLDNRHHPVDVTQLSFKRSRTSGVTLVINGTYVFEYEGLGDYANTAFTLAVDLSSRAI